MAPNSETSRVAYFSMEIALYPTMPTYSGGLGVLAGDTLRSAADLSVPMVAVSLLHRKGYFRQRLDAIGNQTEEPEVWAPEEVLAPTHAKVSLMLEGREVWVRAWHYSVVGVSGHVVPVYLLDTRLLENSPWDQTLTDHLYGGDEHYRLCQEVVLGIGGIQVLEALGCREIDNYHMNEGHSALLALGLLWKQLAGRDWQTVNEEDTDAVRRRCIFTTHTPVPAGHDRFPAELVRHVLGEPSFQLLKRAQGCSDGELNMTYLALRFSHYVNGVAMQHGEVSRGMFPRYPIHAITNGVHAVTWTASSFRDLYDRRIPEWRNDNLYLRYAISIPLEEIRAAHVRAKCQLLEAIARLSGVKLEERIMTLGFARRASTYKRADLLFQDLQRLKRIAQQTGPFQVVFAGKAHPRDEDGKGLIRRVHEAGRSLGSDVRVVYLENYDFCWGQRITSGVDLWLNTPRRPQEASGTSGMKAALNGVPSFSVLDGWWIEGHVEDVTGWAIGDGREPLATEEAEASALYDKLERVILPMFYARPSAYLQVMRSAIALNGAFFNTQRMVQQYVGNAYFPALDRPREESVAEVPQISSFVGDQRTP